MGQVSKHICTSSVVSSSPLHGGKRHVLFLVLNPFLPHDSLQALQEDHSDKGDSKKN